MPTDPDRLRGLCNPPVRGGVTGFRRRLRGRAALGRPVRDASRPAQCISAGVRAALVAFVALAIAANALPALAQQPYKPEYKLSVAVGPAYPWGKGADIWAQLIKERTAGRINVKLLPGASATGGDPAREFAALREGSIDLAVGSTLNWSASVTPLNLFGLPFLFTGSKSLDAVLNSEAGNDLLRAVDEAGVVALAWGDNDFHQLSASGRPLRAPGDFAGLRLRVTGPPIVEESLAALGATPVRSGWLDAQKALLDGRLQGQETSLAVYVATKSQTLGQKQVTVMALAAEPLLFAASRQAWNGWSEQDRAIVRQAAIDAAQREFALARRASADAAAVIGKDLRGSGVVLTQLKPGERAALAAATRPVFDKWTAEIGPGLVKRAQDAAAASASN